MSLSAKEKMRLRNQQKSRLKPTGLFLYHPASDNWIPAQCDDEGRLVIDPADLDTRYHKKGEDLDVGAFDLMIDPKVGTAGLKLTNPSSSLWRFSRHDDGAIVVDFNNEIRTLAFTARGGLFQIVQPSNWGVMRFANDGLYLTEMQWRLYDDGNNNERTVIHAKSGHGTGEPFVDIPYAGDITLLANKVFDTSSGIFVASYASLASWPTLTGDNGTIAIVYNTTVGETRLYVMSNGSARYVELNHTP